MAAFDVAGKDGTMVYHNSIINQTRILKCLFVAVCVYMPVDQKSIPVFPSPLFLVLASSALIYTQSSPFSKA